MKDPAQRGGGAWQPMAQRDVFKRSQQQTTGSKTREGTGMGGSGIAKAGWDAEASRTRSWSLARGSGGPGRQSNMETQPKKGP